MSNSNFKEIVTKTVVGKGRKIFKSSHSLTPENTPNTVLGCWVINHNFKATLNQKKVDVNGCFEIDVWYSYDDNTKTDIARGDIFFYLEKFFSFSNDSSCDNFANFTHVYPSSIQYIHILGNG